MRLIDADALKRDICQYCNDVYSDAPCEPSDCEHMRIIDNQPTIDAVEVVRCRDCRNILHDRMGNKFCDKHGAYINNLNDFCPCGERRTE